MKQTSYPECNGAMMSPRVQWVATAEDRNKIVSQMWSLRSRKISKGQGLRNDKLRVLENYTKASERPYGDLFVGMLFYYVSYYLVRTVI